MEIFHYAHLPSPVSAVNIALFVNVANAAELRARIVRAASIAGEAGDREREAVNFAFVDARLVSPFIRSDYRLMSTCSR